MKQFPNCYCEKLTNILNDCLKENKFPNLMKVAKISPVFKKLGNTSKNNYRAISTLPNFAKLFESIIYSQLNDYMENKLEKNNGSKVGAITMDLSNQKLVIVLIMIFIGKTRDIWFR